ncbi:MAG: DUF3999 family protein [Candidatus Acidiferrum sp.]|jgi:hypothetical protein
MKRVLIAASFAMLTLGFWWHDAYAQEPSSPGTVSLRFQRGVEVPPSGAQQYFVVDQAMWEHARPDLGDVRIYSGGTEVPYVLQTEAGATVREQVDCRVLQPATVAGNTQFILDMTQTEEYSSVNLELQTKNFVAHARIEGANDVHAKDWALLGSSTLYDFTSEELGHNSTLQMPVATFRYLRMTLDGVVKRDQVKGAKAGVGRGQAARWVTVGDHPTIAQQGRDTVLSFSRPANVPAERVRFEIDDAQPNFVRNLEVQSVEALDTNEKTERPVGNGTITKVHLVRGGKKIDQENFDVPIFTRGPGTLKIVVHNGDDQPLRIADAQVQQLERRIYFETPAASVATLYYGSEKLGAPSYDYAKLFQMDPTAAEDRVLAEEVNAAYQKPPDPRPWSERHPAAMWAALIAAILVLGAVAVRSLRSATA